MWWIDRVYSIYWQGSWSDNLHSPFWRRLTLLGGKPVSDHGQGAFQVFTFTLSCDFIVCSFNYVAEFITCQTLSCDYTLDLPNFEHVSEAGKDFIKKLLVLEPSERQTAAETLQHPWLTDNRVGLDFENRSSAIWGRGGRAKLISIRSFLKISISIRIFLTISIQTFWVKDKKYWHLFFWEYRYC